MLHVKVHVSDKDFQIRKPSIVIYMTESRIAINLFILSSCLSAFPPVQRLLLGNGFRTMALGAAYLLKRNPITYKITYPLLNRALGVNRKCKMPVTNITISSWNLVIWQNPYSEIYTHICCFIFNQISITANIFFRNTRQWQSWCIHNKVLGTSTNLECQYIEYFARSTTHTFITILFTHAWK